MRELLEAVVSSQTSLNASGGGRMLKPSCLIIDEVDGALPAAVEILAEAAGTPLVPERRRGRKKSIVLRRPVICICNDLYVRLNCFTASSYHYFYRARKPSVLIASGAFDIS